MTARVLVDVGGRVQTKLLTFQSWVTRWDWYTYAKKNPQHVPLLLVDRSPCLDPFFDPYAPSRSERRPLISGLCRLMKGFQQGDRFIYVTSIDSKVGQELGFDVSDGERRYFGVAALVVKRVWPSHAAAAETFQPRRYVAAPYPTSYPPNLAHERRPVAAAALESSITHDLNDIARTPPHSSTDIWRQQYHAYVLRQRDHRLRVAECQVELVDGREAIQLSPHLAPILTRGDWGGLRPNVLGRWITEAYAAKLRARIAQSES